MTEILRTPDERFENLPGHPYAPHWLDDLPGYEGLRLHYLDEGPADGHVFLCLHGQPTWSYLYRRMIPIFTGAGHRVIAPDLFGFGRSDKPAAEAVYTFDFHRGSLLAFIERLGLAGATLVVQDWGGLLGLTLPMDLPGRFARLLVMNTALGTGDVVLPEAFSAWRQWCRDHPDMAVGRLLGRVCPHLTPEEQGAYDAPFPDVRFKAAARRFPELVPDRPDAPGAELSRRAREWWKREGLGQVFMAIGMQDPVLGPEVMRPLARLLRCPRPLELAEAGHYVQEWGEEVARRALESYAGLP